MSKEKEILVTKTNSLLGKYIVEKDTRFDVVNSEQIIERLQKENKELKKANELKNGLLADLGCPTTATAKRLQLTLKEQINKLEQENKELKETRGRCAFKCLDNTFCDEAKIKINKLEFEKDCLNSSLETARKYRGIAEADRDKYKQTFEEIREITEKLITELPEYNSCYYKDECGDNCTPKKQGKVEYCCYENVDKILTTINEVLK